MKQKLSSQPMSANKFGLAVGNGVSCGMALKDTLLGVG